MATLSPTSMFQSWELSRQEYLTGSIFTTLQIQCIQNQIVALAHEKMMLKFDPTNVLTYAQQEAELQGKLIILQYLLSCSEEAAKELDPGLAKRDFSQPRETPPDENGSLFPPLLPSTNIPPDDSSN